jgi:predicted metal-binding protein
MKIGIDDQVTALEEAVIAHRTYVNVTRGYVERKERPEELLKDTEARLPKMEAALKTLKWVQENREIIIQAKKALDK